MYKLLKIRLKYVKKCLKLVKFLGITDKNCLLCGNNYKLGLIRLNYGKKCKICLKMLIIGKKCLKLVKFALK